MKNYPILLIAVLFAGIFSASAEETPDIQLRGILDIGSERAFSLSNKAGSKSNWSRIGQSFNGYLLQAFDMDNKVLTVENGGEKIQLTLVAAVEATEATGTFEERLAEAARVMHLMNFDTMMEETIAVQEESMSDMLRQQLSSIGAELDEEYIQFQSKVFGEMFDEIDWEPIKQGMSEVYAEVFTKDELMGMSHFYTTPAGKASIEKMPEVQQKTLQVMMPPMMKASENMAKKFEQFYKDREEASQEAPE